MVAYSEGISRVNADFLGGVWFVVAQNWLEFRHDGVFVGVVALKPTAVSSKSGFIPV